MLKYNHVFNTTNLDQPYHVHIIDSDSTSVAVNLNNNLVGYYKPTVGSLNTFTSYLNIPNILDLMVVGSRQIYDAKKESTFFKVSTVRYISNHNGQFLVKNNNTGLYFWSYEERTSFFFNPEYFSSNLLWEITIGYVPTGVIVNDLWDEATANDLFLSKVYTCEEFWIGEKQIDDVEPMAIDYFNNNTEGISKEVAVDFFIEELQQLVNGDILSFNNGSETLEVEVKNVYTSATYPAATETTRPIVHVPVDIVNPNKKYVYSKALAIGVSETVNIVIEGNSLQFDIARIAEV